MTHTRRHLARLIVGLVVAAGLLFGLQQRGEDQHDQKIDQIADDFVDAQP